MITTGILIVVDIIWLSSVGPIWTTTIVNNEIWNSFHGAHIFNIILSSISVFIKVKAFLQNYELIYLNSAAWYCGWTLLVERT